MDPNQVAAEIAERFTTAWNRHDMGEFALIFHDDASFVNVVGLRMRGRAEIQHAHASVHAGPYRESQIRVEIDDARELAPTVILAGMRSELSGDERRPGEVRRTVLTLVIDRRGDAWGIAAAQNTLIAAAPPVA
jgi:uncharacterized protein (TIGR02246 family)